jgi:hypothetical protein
VPPWISHEPAVWIGLIDALLVVGVTFGLQITPEQKGAVDAVLAAVAAIVIRSQVTPNGKLPPPAPAAPAP